MKSRSLLHKLLSALLCLTLVFSLLPVSAFAEGEEETMQPAALEQSDDAPADVEMQQPAAKPADPKPDPAASAMFYYLNDATANPADTGTAVWSYLGNGSVNTAGHDFASDLVVDGDYGRVESWPSGFEGGVVSKGTEAFKNILTVYNDSLKDSDIKENQIKEIKLVPYKLVLRNDGYHVDCTVVIEASYANTVTFMLKQPGADSFAFYDSFNVHNGTKIDGPSNGEPAEADGAAFDGWYADKECTVPADFQHPVNSNVTFYGKYEPKPVPVVSYVVKFVEQGNPANVLAEQITGSGKVGDTVAVGAVEVTGYSLVSPVSQTVDLKEGSNEIIFEYVRTGYKVNYLVDGKPYGETAEYPYGTAVKLAAAPAKEGYAFSGWSVEEDFVMPAHDVEIIGSFNINSYKLSYVVDGETVSESEVKYGEDVAIMDAPAKEGYTFSGWSVEEDFAMPAHDVEISGSFNVNSYKLSYVVDGETVSESEVKYGEDVAIMDAPGREGYAFSGWSVEEDFAMPAHDVEISGSFALRTDLSYTVNYLEAGTNEPLAAPATVAAQTFGGRVTVSPIAIDGYTTPMAQSIVIDAGNNTVNFYYAAVPTIAAAPVVDIPQIAPAPETIDDEQTPLAAPVTVSVDEPVAIADEQTPLAGGEHLCCLLHFFILCAALVVELLYISGMKKRQQDIFDKRRELSK